MKLGKKDMYFVLLFTLLIGAGLGYYAEKLLN